MVMKSWVRKFAISASACFSFRLILECLLILRLIDGEFRNNIFFSSVAKCDALIELSPNIM